MKAKQQKPKKVGNLKERGITPSKVAYMYGISVETLYKWLNHTEAFDELMVASNCYPTESRKWSPRELELVFEFFGDPRVFKDIIGEFDDFDE